MIRKSKYATALAFAACIPAVCCIAGCLWSKGNQARRTTLTKDAEPEPIVTFSEDSNGSNDSAPPKGFFKNTRLPGALSSEAADIERNLGIGR